jgi:hypothetical protein
MLAMTMQRGWRIASGLSIPLQPSLGESQLIQNMSRCYERVIVQLLLFFAVEIGVLGHAF